VGEEDVIISVDILQTPLHRYSCSKLSLNGSLSFINSTYLTDHLNYLMFLLSLTSAILHTFHYFSFSPQILVGFTFADLG